MDYSEDELVELIERHDANEAFYRARLDEKRAETKLDDAWEEWSHYNWSDFDDMDMLEKAFRAGWAAAKGENDV